MQLLKGDCMELLKDVPDHTVDMILCDLPYGITKHEWDKKLPMDELKKEYLRVLKGNGVIVLFANQPFVTDIMNSFRPYYAHTWYWVKNVQTCGTIAKVAPLRQVEEILVFRARLYNENYGLFPKTREYLKKEKERSKLTGDDFRRLFKCRSMHTHYFCNTKQFQMITKERYEALQTTGFFQKPYEELLALYNEEAGDAGDAGDGEIRYYPQGLQKLEKPKKSRKYKSPTTGKVTQCIQEYTSYPRNVLYYDIPKKSPDRHPTQKPVDLLEYLIKTYTKEGELVLDNTMGCGSTGVAAVNTGRDFIGMELNDRYFEIATRRIHEAQEAKGGADDDRRDEEQNL